MQDLASVQKLQKRLGQLEMDISVHQEKIDSLSAQAQGFVDAGHFDSAAIRERQETLVEMYDGLRVREGRRRGVHGDLMIIYLQEPVSMQKSRLEASSQLQQLFRDIEDEEAWIKEREAIATSTNVGKDLTGVQSLQKKHQVLMV